LGQNQTHTNVQEDQASILISSQTLDMSENAIKLT